MINYGYKVVVCLDNGNRLSVWLGCWEKLIDLALHYPSNTVVNAPENSLGIMCFKDYKDAENFIINLPFGIKRQNDFEIIHISYLEKDKVEYKFIFESRHTYLECDLREKKYFETLKMINNLSGEYIDKYTFLNGDISDRFFENIYHQYKIAIIQPPKGTILLKQIYCLT